MSQVAFISYARDDSAFALRIAADLKAAKAQVWLDQVDIRAGQQWDREVEQALSNCPQVIVILSPAAVDSNNVMDEVAFALDERKNIIPVVHRDCRIPFRLRRLQYVDFRLDYAIAIDSLIKALNASLLPPRDKGSEADGDQVLGEEAGAILSPEQQRVGPEKAEATSKTGILGVVQTAVVETSIRGFCLPWLAKDESSRTIRNAAVLLTNVNSLAMADLSRVAEHCRNAGRAFVLVAPTLERSAVQLTEVGVLSIEAADLYGQPLDELLEDLGSYLGGGPILREVGFGLPPRPDRLEKTDKGIYYPNYKMYDILVNCLCTAREVRTDSHQTCFESEEVPELIRAGESTIRVLKYRAANLVTSNAEFDGLVERLRRFGAVEPVPKRIIEGVTFESSANEITLPVGFASRYFITDMDRYHCSIQSAKTLVTTCSLSDADVIAHVLEQASGGLVVFAPKIHELALATMITNKLRGTALCLAVQACGAEELYAVAHLTGAGLVEDTNSNRLLRSSISGLLGQARKVVAEVHKTTITR